MKFSARSPPHRGLGLEFVGMMECHSYIMLYSRRDFADIIKIFNELALD